MEGRRHRLVGIRKAAGFSQERLADAWDWAKRHPVTADDEPTYLAEFDLLTLARLLLAQYGADHEPDGLHTATGLLDRVLMAAEAADRGGSIIEARLVQALAHHARGNEDAAQADLRQALDPQSFVRVDPRWRPTLPTRSGEFRMVDFLTFAGVDPATRGQ